MPTMPVLRVALEGLTTSFRYPHLMIAVQPSFPMPPPATIYGHICSTLGDWFDPRGVRFAYHFTSDDAVEGANWDMEHVAVLSGAGGKLPGTTLPKVLEGNVNPYSRQILFNPRLTLYINRPDWEGAFRSPTYPVALGRSQDLCMYTDVRVVELGVSDNVYFEHTLLPYQMATETSVGVVTLMPRWLDYERHRRPTFERYLMLQRRLKSAQLLTFDDQPAGYYTDPLAPLVDGLPRGLVFHSFVEGNA